MHMLILGLSEENSTRSDTNRAPVDASSDMEYKTISSYPPRLYTPPDHHAKAEDDM